MENQDSEPPNQDKPDSAPDHGSTNGMPPQLPVETNKQRKPAHHAQDQYQPESVPLQNYGGNVLTAPQITPQAGRHHTQGQHHAENVPLQNYGGNVVMPPQVGTPVVGYPTQGQYHADNVPLQNYGGNVVTAPQVTPQASRHHTQGQYHAENVPLQNYGGNVVMPPQVGTPVAGHPIQGQYHAGNVPVQSYGGTAAMLPQLAPPANGMQRMVAPDSYYINQHPIGHYPAMGNPVNLTQAPITQQQHMRDWSSDYFSCFDDISSCILGAFCPCILAMTISCSINECCCAALCCPVALRTKIRTENNIMGTICEDGCIMCACYCCALCQIAREIDAMTPEY